MAGAGLASWPLASSSEALFKPPRIYDASVICPWDKSLLRCPIILSVLSLAGITFVSLCLNGKFSGIVCVCFSVGGIAKGPIHLNGDFPGPHGGTARS